MRTSESTAKLAEALKKAQEKIGKVEKNATANAGKFSYSYADLATIIESSSEALRDNNLVVSQGAKVTDLGWALTTRLMHTSGEWTETDYPLVPIKQNDFQAMGAAYTYARRFSLKSILCIPEVDDEGAIDIAYKQPTRRPATIVSSSSATGVVPFGKHKGKAFSEIPFDYLTWLKGSIEEKADPRNDDLLSEIKAFLSDSQSVPISNGSDFANQDIPY